MTMTDCQGIVALTENGLELDVFSPNKTVLPAQIYKINGNSILIGTETHLKVYNFENYKLLWEKEVGRIRQIEIGSTENGLFFGCLLNTKKLLICHLNLKNQEKEEKNIEIASFENVTSFEMVKDTVLVQINRELSVFDVEEEKTTGKMKLTGKMKIAGLRAYFMKKNVFVVWAGTLLSIYKGKEKILDFTFAQVDSIDIKISEKCDYVLCSATSTASGSYFGHKELFCYNLKEKKGRKINLQSPNCFEFVNNGYSVCFGPQPAKASVFNYDGLSRKSFPKGTRNRIYFSGNERFVGFAGFDNLNGMIEIYNARSAKIISSIKMLGASQVIWSPCERYFGVAITNALKVENKIVIYDYFGREIAKKEFKNLVGCEWTGEKREFTELKQPETPNIYKEGAYVPSFGSLKR